MMTSCKEKNSVRRRIGFALVALALVGAPLAAVTPSAAREAANISINPDRIAFGYRDGYWDRDHHWHKWRNRQDANWYKAHYGEHYYDRTHGQDKAKGWHEADRWWDRH